jgi:hypothetical protein
MRFLRGVGPDIAIDEVMQLSDDSSSSNASSIPNEESARFAATQSHYATISLFHRKSLSESSGAGSSTIIMQPIFIEKMSLMTESNEPTNVPVLAGLEIVLWRPVLPAIALQFLPDVLVAKRNTPVQPVSPPLIIGEDGVVHVGVSSPVQLEFQTDHIRPSPAKARGQKARHTGPPRRKSMSLPTLVSSDPNVPLSQSTVRRGARRSNIRRSNKEGYCTFRLVNTPSKNRKAEILMIDEATGQTDPVPVSVLQEWGIKCGVAPGELTEDALMQAPSDPISNDDPTA